jgi:C4-dicarboxylate transporter, DctM subunit
MGQGFLGIIGFILVFLLIFLKVPIAFAFSLVGFAGLVYCIGFQAAVTSFIGTFWSFSTSFALLCVPLFILMGQFISFSGVGGDLYKTAEKWIGRLPGGLALATTWGMAAFAACTGSSGAGIMVFAPLAFRPMKVAGYDNRLILGTFCCGATMGTMIPPSITFIIYGSITDESIGKLFMAGIIPGILEAVMYSIVILLIAGFGIWKGPRGKTYPWSERFRSLKNVWGFLLIMVTVIGGIYLGFFTPTEAAGVGATAAFILLIARRRLTATFNFARSALKECLLTSSMVFFIVIGSEIFARFIAFTKLNLLVADWITTAAVPPLAVLSMIVLIMFILGFIMPVSSIIVLVVPFVYPIVTQTLGFNGIWFGVLVCIAAELGVVTPPIGMNLFVTNALFKKESTMGELYAGVMPFIFADFLRAILIIAFPLLALWLPGKM